MSLFKRHLNWAPAVIMLSWLNLSFGSSERGVNVSNGIDRNESTFGLREGVEGVAVARLEKAFRKGLGSLKGRVDLTVTNGTITVRAQGPDAWNIELVNYRDIPPGGLVLLVPDVGNVKIKRDGGADGDLWLASQEGGKDVTSRRMRPEVAFRKALESVKWHLKPPDYSQEKGRIVLSRKGAGYWLVELKKYSSLPQSGLSLSVEDDGSVENRSMF